MSKIDILVSRNPPKGHYRSSSDKVETGGKITLGAGVTSVRFQRGREVTAWVFQDPWITFTPPGGPFTVDLEKCNADQVVMSDHVPGGGHEHKFLYALYTSAGPFDPEIINKG
jgi:hypothetical protein